MLDRPPSTSRNFLWARMTSSSKLTRSSSRDHNPEKENLSNSLPPLLGYRGLVYDTLDKANLFAETLEETFTENPEPYDDDHIEDVERQVRRFFRTTSFQPPHLTSPRKTSNTGSSETSTNHQLLRPDQSGYQRVQQRRYYRGCLPRRREKAFDRVWHDGLIFKMIKLNFPSYIIHLDNIAIDYENSKTIQKQHPWVRQVEYLGVTLDSKLTFNSHLRKITCKFKRTLYTPTPLLNRSSILSLRSKDGYLQYLQPTLTYACQIEGCAAKRNKQQAPNPSKPNAPFNSQLPKIHRQTLSP
ncbi:hypothetical protein TNCV_784041 [Trichonephila clavipes]|nr:hypothetical protein TNCV_784041 [Trichonephila clavipes]